MVAEVNASAMTGSMRSKEQRKDSTSEEISGMVAVQAEISWTKGDPG